MHRPSCLAACLLLLAACGGGGGGGSSGDLPAGSTPRVLGSRAVPGYTLQVNQVDPALGGHGLTVTVAADPDQAPPATVEAAISASEPATWIAGSQDAAGIWSWTVTLPADLAGLRAWVRVTDAEGNVSQSGAQDFGLSP